MPPPHGRQENRLDFATKAWLVLEGFSSAWRGQAFLRAGYSPKWPGLGPVLGWGRVVREGTHSARRIPTLAHIKGQPEGVPGQAPGLETLSSNPGSEASGSR